MKKGRDTPLKGGDEYDALTKARKYYNFGRKALKVIKRGYNKRVRRNNKKEVKNETKDLGQNEKVMETVGEKPWREGRRD